MEYFQENVINFLKSEMYRLSIENYDPLVQEHSELLKENPQNMIAIKHIREEIDVKVKEIDFLSDLIDLGNKLLE